MYAETRGMPDKPLFSNIEYNFPLGTHCNVNKLSMDSTGLMIADVDFPNIVRDTTIMLRLL